MTRIVLDTNVLVSALIQPAGIPATLTHAIALRGLTLYVSPDILTEYHEVLHRPKFAGLDPDHIAHSLAVLTAEAIVVQPTMRATAAHHESDNRFLECAEAANAAYLITGNARHFPELYKGTKIVTPRRFLELITGTVPRQEK